MVATSFITPKPDVRWLNYLALSLLANLLIVSVININKNPMTSQGIKILNITLTAQAMPAQMTSPNSHLERGVERTEHIERIKGQAKPSPSLSHLENIMTSQNKEEKMALLEPHTTSKPFQAQSKPRTEKNQLQKLASLKPTTPSFNHKQGEQSSYVIHKAKGYKQTPPIYPRRAFELGQEGLVMLGVEVSPDGMPRQLKIAKSSGYVLLDMAAFAAVKKWTFEPSYENGKLVSSWVNVPVEFVIK